MGHEEHGGTWHMDAAQLDTQRKKGEAILKTSSTVYSTNRSKLDRPSFNSIELRTEDRVQENADLGEPECYDFEEYEAPRMNPSVVAAHKRIGLLQRFNKWQGKAMEKMQKSMDKMVSKIKSLEKKVSGSSSKKKKSKTPTKEEGEDNSQRRRKSSKTRRSNSISELDRAEGRVDLEEPLFENLGFEYDSTQYQDFSQTLWTPYNCFEQAQLLQGQGSHTHFNDEEEEEEEPQARSSEPNPVEWSVPDGRLPSPDHDLVSQFFGGTEVFWSILEHMGHEEHGGTWHMDAAQLDTQRKKGEAILKTSSTVYSTNRSSSSTRPAKLQLDRAEKSTVKPEKCCFPLDFPLTLNLKSSCI
ncbi:unnamed protein product [Microthlaspi erraticum]|uniref:Arabidopsis retrotransposon Orf1 C-terminal domain-containing protein n=1 Tax=Microthlaspi erraticum TaxID=1685480 RepID=A0A6D2J9W5_9BRAS|nr:unnamed protein product [Microthlaspi erraticum]